MSDTFTFTLKPIVDLSDAKANVNSLQQAFSKLKLPNKITGKLESEIANFNKAYENAQKKMSEGIKTSGDFIQLQKSNNMMVSSWSNIAKIVKEVSNMDLSNVLRFDTEEIVKAQKELSELEKQLESINLSKTQTANIQKAIENVQAQTKSGKVKDLTSNMLSGLSEGNFRKVFDNYIQLKKHHQEFINMFGAKTTAAIENLGTSLEKNTNVSGDITQKIVETRQEVDNLKAAEESESKVNIENKVEEWNQATIAIRNTTDSTEEATKAQLDYNKSISKIESQIESYFGLNAIFRKVANMAREAMNTVKELDKAMAETAVVTNFSVGDMWEKLPIYTAEANKLGSTIKDVYEATTLYYQQGLNTTQSMGLAVETLKMARIAGMDAKDATDAMTAALRGFNLEINQASAQRINDVYSQLAANTASNTQEISTAMEKVASLAHNAGMELETTAAFLAQMIETTREAPENLGTALKTVVARFQEMKQDPTKLVDSEGVMLDANKVDKALKSIGVQLMDTNGQFRKLDDVFLEIASKWDTLTMGQQRYIATMAAGSRQQSRFIAMMSNYSRTIELVDMAYDASGASQRQFEKTLESMDSKLNQLKNAWDQFIMGLMNNEFLKTMVDLGKDALDFINKIIDGISSWTGPLKGTTKMLLTLLSTFGGLTAAKGVLQKGIGIGVQWFGGKDLRKQVESKYFGKKERETSFRIVPKIDRSSYDAEKQRLINETKKPLIQRISVDQAIDKGGKVRKNLTDEELKQGTKWSGYDANTKQFYTYVDKVPQKIAKTAASVNNLGASFQSAGIACQAFGNMLQNTPLAPFGKIISITGTALMSLGGTFATVSNIMITESVGLGTALWTALTPVLAIAAAVAAVAAMGYVLYREFTRDKREMEALAEAAKASSDAFDNLKTATEELKNSIEEIRNSDSLFDGLIVGTTEWNLALVEANQQILDLIKKYPILQKYMSTDANGRMHISEAGFKVIQEEQKQKLGQAQALDILTNAEHNNRLLEQEQKKILKDKNALADVYITYTYDENGNSVPEYHYSDGYNKLSEEDKREYGNIQAKIDAESAAAREQAVRAALSTNGELNNTIISLFGQNLEEVEKQFEGETDLDTIKYAYAEFVGGVYDPLTKALTDAGGEDVGLSDDALKQIYPQIMALLQYQQEAPKVESAVESLGKSFDSVFGSAKGSNFINDLLNNNLEIDLSQLEEFRNMEVDEIVDILGDSGDELAKVILQNENASAEDLANQLKANAENLKQIQTKTYADAAVWYAKSKGVKATQVEKIPKQYANLITKGLTVSSAAAANKFMSQISQSFDSATAMQIGNNLFDVLLGTDLEAQEKVNELINSIDWTSAIERGSLYTQFSELTDEGKAAFEALTPAQQKFIRNQKRIDKSLDLTGKQFEELVQSSDFLDILTEKWSEFADDSGKVDASGIREMAKECGTLAKVLELDGFSAENLATALNYFQETGSFDGINAATLAAMQHFNALGNLVNQVKKDLDEFDEGQDYSEGIEAYRERMGTIKENYENGYYSNETALNAIKNLFGEKFYYEKVKEFGSNKELEKYLINNAAPLLTDNLQDTALMAIDNMAHGLDVFGEKMTDDIDERLKVFYGNNGLEFDIGDMTYDEVAAEMATRLNVSEELARGILEGLVGQDWGIVGDNLAEDLMKNGRSKGLDEFQRILTTQTTGFNTEGGYAAVSQSMFDALLKTGGYLEEFGDKTTASNALMADLNERFASLGVTVQTFDDTADNLNSYLAAKYGVEETDTAGMKQAGAQLFDANLTKGVGNFDEAIKQLQADGYNYQKAVELAYNQAKELDLKTLLVDGKEMDISDILNVTDFNDAVEDFSEMGHWEDIGNTLGDAIVQALYEAGIGNGRQKEEESSTGTNTTTVSDDSSTSIERIELKVDRSQAEKSLELVENRISELNEEIAQRKTLGLDTSDLEEELNAAELQAEQYKNTIQSINSELDRINNRTINIHYAATGNIKPGGLVQETQFRGKNNHISTSGFYAGSSARGRYGTVGPKNKGGLTLTGEKGFEIAWLPSENRSMILGAHGPQMLSLPSDAVVYSHEQSKEIIKQKSIPAGSHAGHYDYPGGSSGGSGSGSGNGSSSSSSSKEKDFKHSNWYKEEVNRFNLNQKINKITQEIERTTQTISDSLEKIGTKYADIANDVEKQAQLLNQTIAEQEKLRDSYRKELEWLANGNRQLWISLTNASNESQEIQISTSQFITGNAETGYSISYAAIENYLKANGFGGDNLIANAEALFNLLNQQISNLQSGFDNAVKAIEEAQKKLQELIEQIKEAFYAYENELTKIYDLTAKLATNEAQLARFSSQTSLLLARIAAGFETVESAAGKLIKMQQADAEYIKTRIQLLKDEIQTRRQDLASLLDRGKAELAYYNQIVAENKAKGSAVTIDDQAREQAAYDAYARAAWAQKYVRKTRMQDGTYVFDLDEDKLAADIAAGNISQETYNIIKEGFDQMQEDNLDLNNAISEAADYMAEIYQTYGEHIKTMADLEKDLIDAFVDAAEKEVKKLEALNSSLSAAIKSVLDQVKKSIDLRRKAEDNAKTENDIAKKQQRLNALRANTNGGNAVEIAQLEKEIAEAQQSYGRSLEDQMLSQMQTQADEAAKQRQEQIDLAKQQIEYNKQAGVYAAQADELLADLESNQSAIQEILASTYELGRGKWTKLVDDSNIRQQVAEALIAWSAIPDLQEVLDSLGEDFSNFLYGMDEELGSSNGSGTKPDRPYIHRPDHDFGPGILKGENGVASRNNARGKLQKVPEVDQDQLTFEQITLLQEGLRDLQSDGIINLDTPIIPTGVLNNQTEQALKALQQKIDNKHVTGRWDTRFAQIVHRKLKTYKEGGLADFTGPAWLDGTKAKPELILNAQDTKNFMVLKDILSDVIRGVNHIDRSETYNNPVEFNINVNVDKIASDYDVDKLTARIKHDIVKDATYRNVTQVRNFR